MWKRLIWAKRAHWTNFHIYGSKWTNHGVCNFPAVFCAADTGLGLFSVNVFMRLREQKVNFTLKKNPKHFSLNSCKNQNKLSVTEILAKRWLNLAFFGIKWVIYSCIQKISQPWCLFLIFLMNYWQRRGFTFPRAYISSRKF